MYNITEASAVALIMKAKTQLIEIVHASAVNKLRVLSLLLTALQNLSAQVKRQPCSRSSLARQAART